MNLADRVTIDVVPFDAAGYSINFYESSLLPLRYGSRWLAEYEESKTIATESARDVPKRDWIIVEASSEDPLQLSGLLDVSGASEGIIFIHSEKIVLNQLVVPVQLKVICAVGSLKKDTYGTTFQPADEGTIEVHSGGLQTVLPGQWQSERKSSVRFLAPDIHICGRLQVDDFSTCSIGPRAIPVDLLSSDTLPCKWKEPSLFHLGTSLSAQTSSAIVVAESVHIQANRINLNGTISASKIRLQAVDGAISQTSVLSGGQLELEYSGHLRQDGEVRCTSSDFKTSTSDFTSTSFLNSANLKISSDKRLRMLGTLLIDAVSLTSRQRVEIGGKVDGNLPLIHAPSATLRGYWRTASSTKTIEILRWPIDIKFLGLKWRHEGSSLALKGEVFRLVNSVLEVKGSLRLSFIDSIEFFEGRVAADEIRFFSKSICHCLSSTTQTCRNGVLQIESLHVANQDSAFQSYGSLHVQGTLDNSNGKIVAHGQASLELKSLCNDDGEISHKDDQGTLYLQTTGGIHQGGAIVTDGDLSLKCAETLHQHRGAIRVGKNVTLHCRSWIINSGLLTQNSHSHRFEILCNEVRSSSALISLGLEGLIEVQALTSRDSGWTLGGTSCSSSELLSRGIEDSVGVESLSSDDSECELTETSSSSSDDDDIQAEVYGKAWRFDHVLFQANTPAAININRLSVTNQSYLNTSLTTSLKGLDWTIDKSTWDLDEETSEFDSRDVLKFSEAKLLGRSSITINGNEVILNRSAVKVRGVSIDVRGKLTVEGGVLDSDEDVKVSAAELIQSDVSIWGCPGNKVNIAVFNLHQLTSSQWKFYGGLNWKIESLIRLRGKLQQKGAESSVLISTGTLDGMGSETRLDGHTKLTLRGAGHHCLGGIVSRSGGLLDVFGNETSISGFWRLSPELSVDGHEGSLSIFFDANIGSIRVRGFKETTIQGKWCANEVEVNTGKLHTKSEAVWQLKKTLSLEVNEWRHLGRIHGTSSIGAKIENEFSQQEKGTISVKEGWISSRQLVQEGIITRNGSAEGPKPSDVTNFIKFVEEGHLRLDYLKQSKEVAILSSKKLYIESRNAGDSGEIVTDGNTLFEADEFIITGMQLSPIEIPEVKTHYSPFLGNTLTYIWPTRPRQDRGVPKHLLLKNLIRFFRCDSVRVEVPELSFEGIQQIEMNITLVASDAAEMEIREPIEAAGEVHLILDSNSLNVTNKLHAQGRISIRLGELFIGGNGGAITSAKAVEIDTNTNITVYGLINSPKVSLKSQSVVNVSTGRIYGDVVAIEAFEVVNKKVSDFESEPIIAAHANGSIKILADEITNTQGTIVSFGDLNIRYLLSASESWLRNDSGQISAQGPAVIKIASILLQDIVISAEDLLDGNEKPIYEPYTGPGATLKEGPWILVDGVCETPISLDQRHAHRLKPVVSGLANYYVTYDSDTARSYTLIESNGYVCAKAKVVGTRSPELWSMKTLRLQCSSVVNNLGVIGQCEGILVIEDIISGQRMSNSVAQRTNIRRELYEKRTTTDRITEEKWGLWAKIGLSPPKRETFEGPGKVEYIKTGEYVEVPLSEWAAKTKPPSDHSSVPEVNAESDQSREGLGRNELEFAKFFEAKEWDDEDVKEAMRKLAEGEVAETAQETITSSRQAMEEMGAKFMNTLAGTPPEVMAERVAKLGEVEVRAMHILLRNIESRSVETEKISIPEGVTDSILSKFTAAVQNRLQKSKYHQRKLEELQSKSYVAVQALLRDQQFSRFIMDPIQKTLQERQLLYFAEMSAQSKERDKNFAAMLARNLRMAGETVEIDGSVQVEENAEIDAENVNIERTKGNIIGNFIIRVKNTFITKGSTIQTGKNLTVECDESIVEGSAIKSGSHLGWLNTGLQIFKAASKESESPYSERGLDNREVKKENQKTSQKTLLVAKSMNISSQGDSMFFGVDAECKGELNVSAENIIFEPTTNTQRMETTRITEKDESSSEWWRFGKKNTRTRETEVEETTSQILNNFDNNGGISTFRAESDVRIKGLVHTGNVTIAAGGDLKMEESFNERTYKKKTESDSRDTRFGFSWEHSLPRFHLGTTTCTSTSVEAPDSTQKEAVQNVVDGNVIDLKAEENLNLKGKFEAETINVEGSSVVIEGGERSDIQTETSRKTNNEFNIGSSSQDGYFGAVEWESAKSETAQRTTVTEKHLSTVTAEGSINIRSKGDTTVTDAIITGDSVAANVAGNLTISSNQNKTNIHEESNKSGQRVRFDRLTKGVDMDMWKISEDFKAVHDAVGQRSGIAAKTYSLNVEGDTRLQSAKILSSCPEESILQTTSVVVNDLVDSSEHTATVAKADSLIDFAVAAIRPLEPKTVGNAKRQQISRSALSTLPVGTTGLQTHVYGQVGIETTESDTFKSLQATWNESQRLLSKHARSEHRHEKPSCTTVVDGDEVDDVATDGKPSLIISAVLQLLEQGKVWDFNPFLFAIGESAREGFAGSISSRKWPTAFRYTIHIAEAIAMGNLLQLRNPSSTAHGIAALQSQRFCRALTHQEISDENDI